MNNELMHALDKIVTERTLSLDAVKTVEALKARLVDLEQQLSVTKQTLDRRVNEVIKLEDTVRKQGAELVDIKDREDKVAAREVKIQRLELQAEFAELRRADAVKLVETVFRSAQYTRYGSVNTNLPSGYSNTSTNETVTVG